MLPKRFSEEDQTALNASQVYSPDLVNPVLLQKLDDQARKRTFQVAIEKLVFQPTTTVVKRFLQKQ